MAIIRPHGGKSPRLHESVTLVGDVTVVGDLEIGERSSLWFGAVVRHPTVVGDEVTLGHRVTLHGCTVKDRCLVGIGAEVAFLRATAERYAGYAEQYRREGWPSR
jgi:carbonic anhydrase/acetyltransferase-like protein (isoleucine patch superfamily)